MYSYRQLRRRVGAEGDMVALINSLQQLMAALQAAETENENCILVMRAVLALVFRAPHFAHTRRISFLH
jgi:hypothetical protein